MIRVSPFFFLVFIALLFPLRAVALDPATAPVSPGELPIVPVVQLTVQPGRFLDHDNFVGNVLLRELQRQAVLIAAREELGLGTRDMVLHEPFAVHGSSSVTTVLFESRVWKNDQAQICLSRFDGTQPSDPYALAALQVDGPKNVDQQWVSFKIPKGDFANYTDFVTRCETESREGYLKALKTENVLGSYTAKPTRWAEAGSPAAADPRVAVLLARFDIFSQYLAVRLLHQQIKDQGASDDRMTALVQGYANLAMLTRDHWSRASKVYLARALLYAQRLAVHDNFGAASLCARAYARAFAGLHSAALSDLDLATGQQSPAPSYVPVILAMCRYDLTALEQSITQGPWQYRELNAFLSATVSADKFPADQANAVVNRVIAAYPAMFPLASMSTDPGDALNPKPSDQVINEIPVLVSEELKNAALPTPVIFALKQVVPGENSFKLLAGVRDRLRNAALEVPCETNEPSLGVLADLIEEQEMVAVVHRALSARTTGAGLADVQKLATTAQPILKGHVWGAYVDALTIDASSDAARLSKTLLKIKDRDPGEWVDNALNDIYTIPAGEATDSTKAMRTLASQTTDSLVSEYGDNNSTAYLLKLSRSSPYSATLMEAWLRSVSTERITRDQKFYSETLKRVEEIFSDRPAVALAAYDWCNARADFDRSLKLMLKVNELEPSVLVCNRLAKLYWRIGKHDAAVAQLLRAVKISSDQNESSLAYQQAAVYFIEDGKYNDAMSCIELSAETPTSRVWQLMARCNEAMGRLEEADECFRQQAITDPQSISQHYMWAKRLGRKNTKELRKKAVMLYAAQAEYLPQFFMYMAEDQEHKAYDLLKQNRPQMDDNFQLAQIVILAKKQREAGVATEVLTGMSSSNDDTFGSAFKSLAESKTASAGVKEFNAWVSRQMDDEDAVDWYSLAGRLLVAEGHTTEGKAFLVRALHYPAHERQNFFLAWRELIRMDENPQQLMTSPTTQS